MATVIWALGGCETDWDAVSVLESSRMEFDDLFVFEDPIRLDLAVLLAEVPPKIKAIQSVLQVLIST